jgi:DNA-binding transcriptional MerR regulator
MEYVTIMEAARRCGVSDKTIRRAIHKGTLPARSPQSNRSEIAVSDPERFAPGQLPGHVQVAPSSRLAALEGRVQVLEQQVQDLLNRLEAATPRCASRRTERVTGSLPRHLVSLLAFARLHSVPETKVLTHASRDMALLPVKRGEWIDHDGTVIKEALDAKGRKAFYQLYRELPYFIRCGQCPHGYLDTV